MAKKIEREKLDAASDSWIQTVELLMDLPSSPEVRAAVWTICEHFSALRNELKRFCEDNNQN